MTLCGPRLHESSPQARGLAKNCILETVKKKDSRDSIFGWRDGKKKTETKRTEKGEADKSKVCEGEGKNENEEDREG